MHRITPTRLALLGVAALLTAACTVLGTGPNVTVLRAPADAKLPQVAVDNSGTLHLVYYMGSMTSGDLFHVSRAPDATDWSPPQQVNSRPHGVTGAGPIDGGQIAIDPDGRLHITWFYNNPMRFYYTRSDGAGGFEEQQVLSVKDEGGVESGPTVTADGNGNVSREYCVSTNANVSDATQMLRLLIFDSFQPRSTITVYKFSRFSTAASGVAKIR